MNDHVCKNCNGVFYAEETVCPWCDEEVKSVSVTVAVTGVSSKGSATVEGDLEQTTEKLNDR